MSRPTAGLTFLADGSQHPDQHAMAWDPRVEGRVFSGNDGGVYTSDENGANDTWELADYMPWNQFFTIDISETDPSHINGGVQDNGSVRSYGFEPEPGGAQPPPEEAWDSYSTAATGSRTPSTRRTRTSSSPARSTARAVARRTAATTCRT